MRVITLVIVAAAALQVQVGSPRPADLPTVISFVAPAYPRAARDARVSGSTVTHVTVGIDGRVLAAQNIRAHPFFAQYVVAAIKQWHFKPLSAEQSFDVTMQFELSNDTEHCRRADDKDCNSVSTPETYVSAELPTTVLVRTTLQCVETMVSSR